MEICWFWQFGTLVSPPSWAHYLILLLPCKKTSLILLWFWTLHIDRLMSCSEQVIYNLFPSFILLSPSFKAWYRISSPLFNVWYCGKIPVPYIQTTASFSNFAKLRTDVRFRLDCSKFLNIYKCCFQYSCNQVI